MARQMAELQRVKFLTVIWGARYVEEFTRVSLPSFLAPGNLPHLAAETDLEILVMTSAASVPVFGEQPMFQHLQKLCRVRFILIDDLIASGVYGVTLTLAYARGIQDSGADQTRTHFVFMNADFVLADGALVTLLKALRAGHRCIMAPSLRATSETTLPRLAAAAGPDGTLALPPRQMVRLAFDNLHPTVVGKAVTQGFVTCDTHNQVYWQVDDTTLLARHYLIFMLAITPEVPLGAINSYCDYGFVPEMVPSGEFSVLGDSDDFFMLELQPLAQERQFIRLGSSTIPAIADELSFWTTAEHRRFAEAEVVFRTADPPPGLDAARQGLAGFMGRLQGRLRQPPVSHVGHDYWVMGVDAWANQRDVPDAPLPLELGTATPASGLLETDSPGSTSAVARVPAPAPQPRRPPGPSLAHRLYLGALRTGKRLSGTPPRVPLWHDLWLDSRLVLDFLATVPNRPDARNLLVCDSTSGLLATLEPRRDFETHIGMDSFVASRDPAPELLDGGYAHILLHLRRANVLLTRPALEVAQCMLARDGTIGVYIEHVDADTDPSDFSQELAQYLDSVLPTGWLGFQISAQFVGGTAKRRLREVQRVAMRQLIPIHRSRAPHMIAGCLMWPVVATLTALNNWRYRKHRETCPSYCSAAMLVLRRLPAAGPLTARPG